MIETELLKALITSIFIGALIGLEREYTKRQTIIGVRTFSLISLFGCISIILSKSLDFPIIFALSFFATLWFVAYLSFRYKSIGLTTDFSALIVFFLGALCGFGLLFESTFLAIIVASILYLRKRLHRLVSHLSAEEFSDFLELLILLGVLYPLLPQSIEFWGIVFPIYKIWLIIVFVSLINFLVFILSRIKKISCELLTFSLSFIDSRSTSALLGSLKRSVPKSFVLANVSNYLRNTLLLFIFLTPHFPNILIPIILATIPVFVLLRKKEHVVLRLKSPFGVKYGVKLAIGMVFVILIVELVKNVVPLLYLALFLSGIVNSLITTLALATLPVTINIPLAFVLIQIAAFVGNGLACLFTGGKETVEKSMKYLILMALLMIGGLWL